jgi:hypothetical protein
LYDDLTVPKARWTELSAWTTFYAGLYRKMIWTTGATAWRTFTPSWQQGVNALAQELGIHLVFISAGITGVDQPLDRRNWEA